MQYNNIIVGIVGTKHCDKINDSINFVPKSLSKKVPYKDFVQQHFTLHICMTNTKKLLSLYYFNARIDTYV